MTQRESATVRTWSLDRQTEAGQWKNVAVADAAQWVDVHPGYYRFRVWIGVDDVQESEIEVLLPGRIVLPPGCVPPEEA